MDEINLLWHQLTDSETIIRSGLLVITLSVFAENGLFFAFFLPGDYLLFLTGVFGGTGVLKEPLSTILLSIFLAAVIGSLCGYLLGRFFVVAVGLDEYICCRLKVRLLHSFSVLLSFWMGSLNRGTKVSRRL